MASKIGETDQRLSDTRAISSRPLLPARPGEPFGPSYAFCPIEDVPIRRSTAGRPTGPGSESLTNAVHVANGCKGSAEY